MTMGPERGVPRQGIPVREVHAECAEPMRVVA
jgi:hypothetical protein